MKGKNSFTILLGILALTTACRQNNKHDVDPHFSFVPESKSQIDFENHLPEESDFNIINYLYYYNGGGVAIGDINNDGLEDLYFASNLEENRLYLNKGNLRFEDITESAQVAGAGDWTTGVSIMDINADGFLDIYVCYLGGYKGKKGKNELYINNGPSTNSGLVTFTESAAEYGLDFETFSTQAAFFDYDNDGDLDMYLLNHGLHTHNSYAVRERIIHAKDKKAGDRLLENKMEHGQIKFVDVTEESKIYSNPISFGLGVRCLDVNNDGWSDIYVSNDFHENDYLYINNGDGTFTDRLNEMVAHTSKYSMGVDAGDINNDGLIDIMTLDMLPKNPKVLQKSMAEDNYLVRELILGNGYANQLARNNLQLNQNGHFSEIAPFAGIEATDWSWAPLMADYDNDGLKDIYITNGIYRRPNNLDYLNYTSNTAIQAVMDSEIEAVTKKLVSLMPQDPVSNVAFKNRGGQRFEDATQLWGLEALSHSNGAAYADLDNDGDLELVVNNINQKAYIIENHANEKLPDNNHLKIRLHGKGGNTKGVGTKVFLEFDDGTLYHEQNPVRGFMSSVGYEIHFGLGYGKHANSLRVVWPGGAYERIDNPPFNQTLDVYQKNAHGEYYKDAKPSDTTLYFTASSVGFPYVHKENVFHDQYVDFLVPKNVSREGPAIAVADANGDGLQDFYVTAASGHAGKLFIQSPKGGFEQQAQLSFGNARESEEVDAVFFDADNDGDMDLYVVTAGNEKKPDDYECYDNFYLNTGTGQYRSSTNFKGAPGQNSTVVAEDYDKDGNVDLFVGGRVLVGNYGPSPKSYLYRNNGRANFEEVVLEDLNKMGMVTDAIWVDVNGDGWKELVVVGEWMPVTVFDNNNGILKKRMDTPGLEHSTGWWNTIMAEDFDNDGDMDLVVGNLGQNTKLEASAEKPLRLYVKDFDQNGRQDAVITHYVGDAEYALAEKDLLDKQMPMLKKKFPSYKSFSGATIHDMFTEEGIEGAKILETAELASMYIENLGNGQFKMRPLPKEANISSVMGMAAVDINRDGYQDLIAGGNFYHLNPPLGRQDASMGFVGINDGNGNFVPQGHLTTGLLLKGQTRDLQWIATASGEKLLLVARNNGSMGVFQLKKWEAAVEMP